MDLSQLRQVLSEEKVHVTFNPDESIVYAGEQVRKRRTTVAENVRTWGDFPSAADEIFYAAFIPPGVYSLKHHRGNEYQRFSRFDGGILRKVKSPAPAEPLDELELHFTNTQTGEQCRFIVSGFDIDELPKLPVSEYPKGFYMPMGIGVPPFYQSYEELQQNPPSESPYFSVLLDEQGRWINHHDVGVDGPVMFRDIDDPSLLHVYLLSYERHSLVGHFIVQTEEVAPAEEAEKT